MKIEFNKIEPTVINNFKGGEKYISAKMITDDNNKIMKNVLVPGASIGSHIHDVSSEIIFILNGTGTVICDGKEEIVKSGDCHYCPKGSVHTLMNQGQEELVFYAVVPNHQA